MKKLLSVVLALLMLAVMLPVVAMADEANYCTIEGITEADGTTLKHFGTLTAAAKAWRESNDIATTGGNMGGHPENLTSVDSISWVISGSVGTGDGTGVVGTSGSLLSGGYIYPSIAIKSVYIRGVNNAELKNEIGSDYALSAAAKTVEYDGITFPEYVSFNTEAENVTFKNCTFKGGLKVMQAINVTVDNCKFEGDGSKDFAFFAQSVPANSMKAVQFKNNTVSSFMRGINVQAGTSATVSITGNTITNLTGIDANGGKYGSAIQLTSGTSFTVTDNTINTKNVNAFHLYNGLNAAVTINNNIITTDYLIWNAANLENISSSGNTLDIKYPGKELVKVKLDDKSEVVNTIDSATTINGTVVEHPTTIIITPTGDTPKTEPEKNPTTGANDMVAAAAALMAVSALGMAVLSRKK